MLVTLCYERVRRGLRSKQREPKLLDRGLHLVGSPFVGR